MRVQCDGCNQHINDNRFGFFSLYVLCELCQNDFVDVINYDINWRINEATTKWEL